MNSSIPGAAEPQMLAADEIALLSRRVHAVQKVTEMAAGGAAKLLNHTRQLECTLDRITVQIESLPDRSQISSLAERMESLQAMLDWLTTRSAPTGNAADLVDLQKRLSTSRVRLVNLQADIQQASIIARGLRETRETLAGLVSEIETLASTKATAEPLLLESTSLAAELERRTETSTDLHVSD